MNDALTQRLPLNRSASSSGIGGVLVLAVFGMFWCSLVGGFDYFAMRDLVWQIASAHFVATPAHIIQSQVTSHHSSKGGTIYGVECEYTYEANGLGYRGNRFTFNVSSSSDRDWAREAVAAFPAGSDRVCYFDPQNPQRVVLAPGIHGSDLMILMFLTPFNIVALFLMSLPIWTLLEQRRPATTAPRISDRLHGREAYLMKKCNPVGTFLGLLFLTSFAGIFVVAFSSGFHPTIGRVVFIWGSCFAIALGITIQQHSKMKSGRYDLVLDYGSRSITIPAMFKRSAIEIVAMAEVKQFDTTKIVTSAGRNRRTTWQVKLLDRGNREVLVNESYLEQDANRLAETLNAKLQE